jgi:hypothetical protein
VGAVHGDADPDARPEEDVVQPDALGARSGLRVVYDAKVVEGRDGYLFMADDNNEVMAQHAGQRRLTGEQLEQWRLLLERRTEMLGRRGCAHLVLVAPNNHSVYPEKLPPDIESAAERPVHQLLAHMKRNASPVEIIYPLEELLAAKPDHQVCSPIDSHWTDYGAFLSYLRLIEDARPLVPTRHVGPEDVLFVEIEVDGDLGEKLDPPRRMVQGIARMRNRMARLVYDNCVEGTGSIAVAECDVAPPTTCLLLGDSYCYFIAPFLSECWQRLVLVHAPNLDGEIVDAVKPDIVVTMMAERFLVMVPDDVTGPTMRERELAKREQGRVRNPVLYWIWPTMQSPHPVERMRARLLREGRAREAAFIGLIAYAGLTPAEAMALRWSAIGTESIIVAPLQPARNPDARPREVPLWKPLAEDLETWRRESGGADRRLLFPPPGRPSAATLPDWRAMTFPALARDAGLEGLETTMPSVLRNVYCVLVLDAGESVERVAELTGMDVAKVQETFAGLLTDPRRGVPYPAERAIAAARAAAAL